MFISRRIVHIRSKLDFEAILMPTAKGRTIHKHFRLDSTKLKRAQRMLDARTETETVERALDLAISEHQRSRMAEEANRRFLRSGIVIRDVFGALDR
jgi:hypothetical protein